MAKSTRSKVKRSFRSKKRETGVYAAVEAARLHRLNAKLVSVASKDKDGDVPVEDVEGEELPGWSWFTAFGLLDAADITAESMQLLRNGSKRGNKRRRRRNSASAHLTKRNVEA